MEDYILSEEILENKEKTLTLKSLEKQVNEKIAIFDEKIKGLERNIETLKKVARR